MAAPSSTGASGRVNRSNLGQEIMRLSESWAASLPFKVRVIADRSTTLKDDLSNIELTMVDVAHYLGGQKYPNYKLYFCRDAFPPPSSLPSLRGIDLSECLGWVALKKELCQAAVLAGSPIFCNGSNGYKMSRVFYCIFWKKTTSTPSSSVTTGHWSTSMANNDKQNRRASGRALSRRTKQLDPKLRCSFRFNVS
jgi:hypothetical protein